MNKIAIVGAGTMGTGIAQLAAKHGCEVRLIDVDEDALRRGLDGIRTLLERSVKRGRTTPRERDALLQRIKPATTIDNLDGVKLAIETVVENLKIKQSVFKALEAATPESAILASNTSSLSISSIAEAIGDRSRVVGMHFFNPAAVMPLVEVIASDHSSDEAVKTAHKMAEGWGKIAVRAKDTPGFIVNRVARGFYLEALRLLDEGVAGVDEIDGVMRNLGGFSMGPFQLMDLIGLDMSLEVSQSIWRQLDKPTRLAPHDIQNDLVEQGHLGIKSGRGFYLYEDGAALPAYAVERRSFELTPLLTETMFVFTAKAGAPKASSTEQYLFSRILGAVINESGWVFSQGIATGDDIDTAMVKGTNYPKGPLAWSDDIGHRTVRGLLRALNEVTGDGRYEAAPLFADAE